MAARSSRARVRMKTQRGVEAFITVRLGILTKPGMQKSEAEKFSCCLNLGTMLLRSLSSFQNTLSTIPLEVRLTERTHGRYRALSFPL